MKHEQLPPLPKGFLCAGLACGIKASGRKDLAIFASDRPATAAGVFTQNKVVGAPVKVSRERVPTADARAVLINSGNSNACTGDRGVEDAKWMCAEAATGLHCEPEEVLVCSTGVIGHFLPKEILARGIPAVSEKIEATPEAFREAAESIMTTDTFPKQAVREVEIHGEAVRVAGACKGAAMIAPNMATMLGVIMTDARLTPEQADQILRQAVDRSFNCISVEGHTSTSDTVLLLANGAAVSELPSGTELANLERAIEEVCTELAQQIIRDAEGATHFITIDVTGMRTREEATLIAKTIAEGALVKTAITGNDPNWGRIVSAAGYTAVDFREEDVSLKINGFSIYEAGLPVKYDAKSVSQSMSQGEVHIELSMTLGDARARYWTCDLTAEYVRLNSEYTT